MTKNYDSLDNAVKDLLSELRIDPVGLSIMANGQSPDYPGATDSTGNKSNLSPKVQLSQVVASKLLNTLSL